MVRHLRLASRSNGECCGMPRVVVDGMFVARHLGADVVRMLVECLKEQAD